MDNLQCIYQSVSALKSEYGGFCTKLIQWSVTLILMFVLVAIILVGILFTRRAISTDADAEEKQMTGHPCNYKQDNEVSKMEIEKRWRSVVWKGF